jgi:predicted anti-sigma-YlaC factor YlaD
MTDCDKFRMNFSNYLDGELQKEGKKSLVDHFSECPECHEAYRQVKDIQKSLINLPPVSTSPEFEHNLQQRIQSANQNPGIIPPQLQNWKLPAMGSAIAVAAVSLFLVFNNSSTPEPEETENQMNTAAPQIPATTSKPVPAPETATPPEYESTSLISDSDSLASDTLQTKREKIQQVKK